MVYRCACGDVELCNMEWHVGDVVRKMREGRDWTQDALADAAHVSKATVVRVEAGRETKSLSIRKIAKALGVSVATLYGLVPSGKDPDVDADGPRRLPGAMRLHLPDVDARDNES